VEGVGVSNATPNTGLHRLQLEGYKGEDGLDDRGPEHRGHDHIIIKRTEKTVLAPGKGWLAWIAMKRKACGIALF
jgi:hypothetical protein